MSLFRCDLCSQKDEHITSLKHQIQTLERLVLPKERAQDITLTEVDPETGEPLVLSPDQISEEAGRLLSGDFGHLPWNGNE